MMADSCRVIERWLGPFIDGELTGAERLRVSRHLGQCPACRESVDGLQQVGDLLRAESRVNVSVVDAAGFAQGIVSRSRAEASVSWMSQLRRGSDDWHWVIVGGGALAATVVSTLLWSALLVFGASPVQQDSLAGLIGTLELPRRDVVMRDGPDLLQQDVRLIARRGTADPEASVYWLRTRSERGGRMSAAYGPGAETTYVEQLATLAAWSHPREISLNDDQIVRSQFDLLDEIMRLRLAETLTIPGGTRNAAYANR